MTPDAHERFNVARAGGSSRVGSGANPHHRRLQEAEISTDERSSDGSRTPSQEAWEYAEQFVAEDETLQTARAKGRELGCVPIGAGGGAALQFLAAATGAKAVVEIGTGAGVGALWLLRGMRAEGVLTTIDVEPEHHRAAREAFTEAGIASNRVRLISGRALEVLPRLTDGAYDLVFCDADKQEYDGYLDQALRLLRPGGVVAFDNALWGGRVLDPETADEGTRGVREFNRRVATDARVRGTIIPVGDGLAVAVVS